jgi:hypothetical protein
MKLIKKILVGQNFRRGKNPKNVNVVVKGTFIFLFVPVKTAAKSLKTR